MLGRSLSSSASKNEHLFRGISQRTVDDVPSKALRFANPSLKVVEALSNIRPAASALPASFCL